MTAIDVIESLSFAFIVLILLVLKDMQTELREIRRELKRKDGDHRESWTRHDNLRLCYVFTWLHIRMDRRMLVNSVDDYNYCEECQLYGDDYSYDQNGDLIGG